MVPTRDRPERLLWCLEALAALRYSLGRFEVIVVNDGGTMPVPERLAALSQRMELRVVTQDSAGPAGARNRGAREARGEYLAFTDDDCAPMPNWLTALDDAFRDVPDALVGGRTVNHLDRNLYSEASQLLIEYLYRYYDGQDRGARFFASNNLAVSAAAFRDLQGFDSSFPRAAAEDRDLCARWHFARRRFNYAPDAVVRHAHALSLAAFARQHFGYGRGAYQYWVRHARRRGQKLRIEPVSFYTGLIGFPFRRCGGRRRAVAMGVLMGLSQVVNAVGFFWEWRATGVSPCWAPNRGAP